MWILPEGSRYANNRTYMLSSNGKFKVGTYYRLVQLTNQLFAMVGMAGEIRYCPQSWAQSEAQFNKAQPPPGVGKTHTNACPEVSAWESEVDELCSEVEENWYPEVEEYCPQVEAWEAEVGELCSEVEEDWCPEVEEYRP